VARRSWIRELARRRPRAAGSAARRHAGVGGDTEWELRSWRPEDGESALARELESADAVVTMSWDADTPPAPRMRLLQLPGAGLDGIDFSAVPPRAAVCNVYEHEIGIAEYLVLAMLEWEIALARMDRELRRGRWSDGFAMECPLHGELMGKRVGFIGYGRIARETARRLRPFGVRLLARTRSPHKADEHVDDVAGMDRLSEMLAVCDYVVVACPLTEETRGIVDRRALASMKSDGVLLNVARGDVVDEDALYAALRDERIGGAVIDTWYRYPEGPSDVPCYPSKHPFHTLDNVIMTPHASGWSAGLLTRRARVIAANLDRLARGEALLNVARPAI